MVVGGCWWNGTSLGRCSRCLPPLSRRHHHSARQNGKGWFDFEYMWDVRIYKHSYIVGITDGMVRSVVRYFSSAAMDAADVFHPLVATLPYIRGWNKMADGLSRDWIHMNNAWLYVRIWGAFGSPGIHYYYSISPSQMDFPSIYSSVDRSVAGCRLYGGDGRRRFAIFSAEPSGCDVK